MVCAVCLMTRTGTAPEADTIVGGLGVCVNCIGYAQDERLSRIINRVREEHAGEPWPLPPHSDD